MKKTISILITMMLVSVTIASIGRAVELDGNIEVEVTGPSGAVNADLNITINQSVTIGVDIETDGENSTYSVNDTLIINLDAIDNSGRASFVLPRSLLYNYAIHRHFLDVKMIPILSWLGRLCPALKLYGAVNVADSLLGGKKGNNISIKLDYEISNTTYLNGENLTLNLFVMGFIPGGITGSSDGAIPIPLPGYMGREVINLEVDYYEE
jgi:hypothetical protein